MSVTQLLFNTAHVFDGSIDAIDGEMAEASVHKIFELPIDLPNLQLEPLSNSATREPPIERGGIAE
eukprot:917077-Pleurochrysis_carterae.AAC.1